MNDEWNPRFTAYARANGRTEEEQLAFDRASYPGGQMCGYLLWMSEAWAKWRKQNSRGLYDVISDDDHESFDRMIGVKNE